MQNDILDRLYENEKAITAIQKHADEFIVYTEKYKTDFVNAFSTYPQYTDDIINISQNKHEFLKTLNSLPEDNALT